MKTKIYILSLAIIAILFSSCGSLSISQKRYSRGLNISLFRSKDEKPEVNKAAIAQKKQVKKVEINNEINTIPSIEVPTEIAPNNTLNTIDNNTANNSINNNIPNTASKTTETKIKKRTIRNIIQTIQPNHITKNSNDSDVALIILIILAFFVPPLAVYLYYGEINTQFWISLLLTILAGGLFFVGRAIGWGFPVVHALLVLLGIMG